MGCAECNPGTYRVGDEGGVCEVCPAGEYSEGGGEGACEECESGTYAKKMLFFKRFDVWEELPGVSTGCVGECGTEV